MARTSLTSRRASRSTPPGEYHQVEDFKTGPVMRKYLPGAFRRPRATAAAALEPSLAIRPLPTTVAKAKASPYWPFVVKDAMESEINGEFIDNEAWEFVPRTPDVRVIRKKWVLKFSVLDDGSISKVKAKLIACGYGHREGVDYTDVFASTLAFTSLRILCTIIAAENLETDKIDEYKAFTPADVDVISPTRECLPVSLARAT